MKKVILTIAAMAIAASAFAQASVGVRAGGNYANMKDIYESKYQTPAIGAYLGAAVQYSLDNVLDGFGIRGEVNWSMQGTGKKVDAYNKEKTSANFLNIPIMAQYSILDGALSFMVGPQLGIDLGGKEKIVAGSSKENSTTINNKIDANLLNTVEFGLAMGATFMVVDNIGIDFRYGLGISNIFSKQEVLGKTIEGFGKNNVLSLGVLYNF